MTKITDYSAFRNVSAIPEAASMIETFRAIGYNLETAIADIVDNSISAGAQNVWINFDWQGEETWLSVTDDGCGMNNEELIQAMKPGSKNPLGDRNLKDLGRFGLGLKTASFSQARKLTVISKKENEKCVYWTWDLDYVCQSSKWELIDYLPGNFSADNLEHLKSGTIVIWNDIDRLVKNLKKKDYKALDKFLQVMDLTKKHLGIVFHRFISNKKLNIFFQKNIISAWDPFYINETATQHFPEEKLNGGKIILKGFVLPHKTKLDEEKFKLGEGIRGWNDHQGFYIYRNERLLFAGDWLGMFRKEEHYKLARIKIDLPNFFDADWQIDIKKSIARPPVVNRDQIKSYAAIVRAQAVEVYRHRGKTVRVMPGQKFIPFWLDNKRENKWYYKINRDHPLIEELKNRALTEPAKAIDTLIRFIEETIPTKSIYIKESEEPEAQGKPFENTDPDIIMTAMKSMYDNLIRNKKTPEQAKAIINYIEPFNNFPHFFDLL